MTPRPYQQRAHDAVLQHLTNNPLLVMPTGSGKTFTGTRIIRSIDAPTIWLAHRRELIHQAADALRGYGLDVGLIMAGETPNPEAQVQVASIQTLLRRTPPPASLVVLDEAHHVRAGSYGKLLAAYPDANLIGLTATPFRTDGKGLGSAFGQIIVAATTAELVEQGTLHEPVVYAPSAPDLKGVKIRAGDYQQEVLAATMGKSKITGDLVKTWTQLAEGKRTVIFAVNVAHSESIIEAFRAAGVSAEHLDGKTPRKQRDAILARLASGYTRVVSQCAVLTEGWDLPALEVAVIARPTASLCLHLQMVGRIMRTADAKDGALVLDHAGNHLRHGLVSQELHYSLDDGARGAARDAAGAGRRCEKCYLIVRAGAEFCPGCGFKFPSAPLPEIAEGELTLLSGAGRPSLRDQQIIWDRIERQREHRAPGWTIRKFAKVVGFTPLVVGGKIQDPATASLDTKRSVYRKLRSIAGFRGYNPKWVGIQYKAVFGEWPRTVTVGSK